MVVVTNSVKVIWFPKVLFAFAGLPLPSALEIMLAPPMPMAMPMAPIKNETGKTTLMAAMPMLPIQFPTKMESTNTFRDMTKIPTEAGAAC